jgi:hypothetical protein
MRTIGLLVRRKIVQVAMEAIQAINKVCHEENERLGKEKHGSHGGYDPKHDVRGYDPKHDVRAETRCRILNL